MELEFHPLTPDRWADFESLFGERGACGGCWCMHWRLAHADYERQKGEANKQAMKALVASGEVPGLLAYADGRSWFNGSPDELDSKSTIQHSYVRYGFFDLFQNAIDRRTRHV